MKLHKNLIYNALNCFFILLVFTACSNGYSYNDRLPQYKKRVTKYNDVSIMGYGKASSVQLARFFIAYNGNINKKFIVRFAKLYIQEARKEGVNSDVAFIQMCIETDFLRFGGQVKPFQNNFAGIGSTDDGAMGAKFGSIREGVRAQIQHLKAYASRKPLRYKRVDPRFTYVQRGSARYVSQLGKGKWATDPYYAKKIILKLYQMYNINNIT
ncbi:MAG TPA: glucosaminidase domain-containing protein [Victivallales bacterium]|nr:glucosaminidase domain-containing protein [Victivallales bacterium]